MTDFIKDDRTFLLPSSTNFLLCLVAVVVLAAVRFLLLG